MDDVSIVIPVYNEELSIEQVVREINDAVSPHFRPTFILSEDGSTDRTKEILSDMSKRYNIILLTSTERKGYALGVLDGIASASTKYVIFNDSDGQIVPEDIVRLWHRRSEADIISGNRYMRADSSGRKILSRFFKYYYNTLFSVGLEDPSSPLVVCTLDKANRIATLSRSLGPRIVEGFWWEFNAWACRLGYSRLEIKINHRVRLDGRATNVYKASRLPGIFLRNFWNILRVRIAIV